MERQMDETNCVGIHCFAEAHSCKVLEKHSMEYILENFSAVSQQVRVLRLSLSKQFRHLSFLLNVLNCSQKAFILIQAHLPVLCKVSNVLRR